MKLRTFIIAIILVIGISAIALGLWQMITQSKPLATTETIGINSASSKSINGLNLSLSTDKTTYQPGQYISIFIDEKNKISKTNKVRVSDTQLLNEFRLGPCNVFTGDFGIAVFRGNYTASDFPAATPLIVFDPNPIFHCPVIPIFYPSFDFAPSSDIVNNSSLNSTFGMNSTITVNGYWAGDRPNAILTYFDSGVYTIVGGDEWGNLVIVHFTVLN
jgi:hypothetical protein